MCATLTRCSPCSGGTLLTLSLLFNILLMWLSRDKLTGSLHETGLPAQSFNHQLQQPPAGWSRRAAEAAEAAAAFNCSGNGDLYVDTLEYSDAIRSVDLSASHAPLRDQLMRCECYECFVGPQCADFVPDCDADVKSGDPLLFAPFWKQNAEESAVMIPGWYRLGYEAVEASDTTLTPALEGEIRRLHNLVGNAVVDGKYIVIGVGTTLLLNAAVAGLSPTNGSPASVVAAVPYYQAYRLQTQQFETSHYVWAGDANMYAEQESRVNESISIEFVTSPNNPDASIRSAVLSGTTASTIYDLVYYWPHFTAITDTLDHDVMLFSLSKVTGHAGSRLGWAILKDYSLYARMLKQIALNVVTISHESQLRATQLLRSINKAYSKNLHLKHKIPMSLPPAYYASKGLSFHYAYAVLRYRWEKLSSTLETSQQLELQQVESNYCNFFKEITGPSPAYAWVHCKQANDEECQALLFQAGILVRNGSLYGASNRYARISLLKRDSTFENLVQHISALLTSSEMTNKFLDRNAIS